MIAEASHRIGEKIEAATLLIRELKGAVVALSAGVDSSLVAMLAHHALGDSAVCATGVSKSLAPEELEIAKGTASAIGIRHFMVRTGELKNPDYYTNSPNRCYFCKKTLYTELRELADELGFEAILDGTQVEDLGDVRPGLAAAREAGIISPLLKAGFSKTDVREAARSLGLAVWDKPAMPCLSSRIAHGEYVTVERLDMIGRAELFIKLLTGTRDLRVRYSNSQARIEVPPQERKKFFNDHVMDMIEEELTGLGFTRVMLDLRGYTKKKAYVLADEMVLPMANGAP